MSKICNLMNIVWIFSILLAVSSCNKKDTPGGDSNSYLELTVNANSTRQTIHSFGASDAWSCQFIGKNWPDEKKNQIADWLFSTQMDANNNPKGIGLNTWRFNIGAGSAEQGSGSGIGDEWRRAESFMISKNTYNWNKQEGQRWFLQAAKSRGVHHFIGFVNSPSVYLTKNGKAFSSNKNNYNLPTENYQHYADFLAGFVQNMNTTHGIPFNYISPFNEPQWDWTNGGQEGTPAQNTEIAALTRIINQTFKTKNIASLLEIPETAQLNYLYENDNKAGRGEQIEAFFNSASVNYIGGLSHVAKKIAGHSYYTTWPISTQSSTRIKVKNTIEANPEAIEFWMSEYCLLENNSEIEGNGRDLGMKSALYAARVIFSDLALANSSSWQWWIAVSPYDYKDGLVYTDYNKNDGSIYDSKILWAFGNYSRFIKEGMQRVLVSRNDGRLDEQTLDHLMSSAFVSEDKTKATMVLVNYRDSSIPVKVVLKDVVGNPEMRYYLTDAKTENDLAYQGTFHLNEVIEIPAKCVITVTNQN